MQTHKYYAILVVVVFIMSAWWHLQTLQIGDTLYYVWNHSRYSGTSSSVDKHGRHRHVCTVYGCNAAIYIKDGEFVGVLDHDEWNAIKHNFDSYAPHADWGDAAYFREEAIAAINMHINTGKTRAEAFRSYILSHPHQTHALRLDKISHRLQTPERSCPDDPLSMTQIPIVTRAHAGWVLNYYGQLDIEFEQTLNNDAMDENLKQQLIQNSSKELQGKINSWRGQIADLQKQIDLAEIAVTLKNSTGDDSDFFLNHNEDCTLLVYGEEEHFEIIDFCELLLFDATFDSVPSFGGYLLYDQQWIIHGAVESKD
eukprot:115546_1